MPQCWKSHVAAHIVTSTIKQYCNTKYGLVLLHVSHPHARIQRGTRGPTPPPPTWKNHKAMDFLWNSEPDLLENRKATQQVLTACHHQLASETPSVADGGPLYTLGIGKIIMIINSVV